jgi:hypothetical protein
MAPAPSADDEHGDDEREVAADDQRTVCATQPATCIGAYQRQSGQTEVRPGDEGSLPGRRAKSHDDPRECRPAVTLKALLFRAMLRVAALGTYLTPSTPITTVAHDPNNDETPTTAGVLKYRYRDSKPASEE